jgi:hypothetical protein
MPVVIRQSMAGRRSLFPAARTIRIINEPPTTDLRWETIS